MNIVTLEDHRFTGGGTHYRFIEMKCEKHRITVGFRAGQFSHITVIVHNASQRAHRGLGKQFDTTERAIKHYKTPAIRAMIQHAGERAADLCAQGSANQETPPR